MSGRARGRSRLVHFSPGLDTVRPWDVLSTRATGAATAPPDCRRAAALISPERVGDAHEAVRLRPRTVGRSGLLSFRHARTSIAAGVRACEQV